jgi:hypothetical protein
MGYLCEEGQGELIGRALTTEAGGRRQGHNDLIYGRNVTRLTMLLLAIGVVMPYRHFLVVTDLLHKALGSKPC